VAPSYAFAAALVTTIGGWVIAASGLVAWRLAPSSLIGPWLVGAGAAFLAASFTGPAAVGPLAGPLTWLSAGLLGTAILTMPDGRAHTPAGRLIAAGLILTCTVAPPDRPLLVGTALAVAMLLRRILEVPSRRQGPADVMGLAMILALAAIATTGSLEPVPTLDASALHAAVSAAAGMIIAAVAIQQTPTVTRIADEVLRVDPAVPLSIGRELRLTTGQGSLRVLFPLDGGRGYVDANGEPTELPRPGSGRVATPVASAGGRVEAMVLHDGTLASAITLDPGVARAGALSAVNARLQAELSAQVAEVRASRRRVLEAEQAERRRLSDRLADALVPPLADIESGLLSLAGGEASAAGPRGTAHQPRAATIVASLRDLRRALDAVTEGIHPVILTERGLEGAVRQVAARSPVATTVTTAGLDQPLDPNVAATAWYACSEALANVAKHAQASRASVEVTLGEGRLVVAVEDDGIGGADLATGTGLRGLRDRVETMGGALFVGSASSGRGTRVFADLPVRGGA